MPHIKPLATHQQWVQDRPGSLHSLRCNSVRTMAPSSHTSLFHGYFLQRVSPSGARLTTSSPAGSSDNTIIRKLRPSTVGERQNGPQTQLSLPPEWAGLAMPSPVLEQAGKALCSGRLYSSEGDK